RGILVVSQRRYGRHYARLVGKNAGVCHATRDRRRRSQIALPGWTFTAYRRLALKPWAGASAVWRGEYRQLRQYGAELCSRDWGVPVDDKAGLRGGRRARRRIPAELQRCRLLFESASEGITGGVCSPCGTLSLRTPALRWPWTCG